MESAETKFEGCLRRVQKPARYIGNEFNSVHKTEREGLVSFAFCFPDVYEVGMSHLGMKILYHMMNERDDTVCERVFAPWVDMEDELRKNKIPLLSLESHTPVAELDLAEIPLRSAERDEECPFVCAGGPCAYNGEPLADIIDFFILGEGEEINNEIIDVYKKWKASGKDRRAYLEMIAELEGIYVPSFYDVEYNGDGTVKSVKPNCSAAPERIRKRIVKELDESYVLDKMIVPFMDIVHDRIMLEVFRGCIRGCRFCQAGYLYRPVREHSADVLVDAAQKMIDSTGYEEMSLSSLSTSDYTCLQELIDRLLKITVDKRINLSLPSLRVDNFSMELMEKVQKVKKSGLTFAPEAGTQRLRDVINKNVLEEDLLRTAKIAFDGGYNRIKLYFMIGLPTETIEDVEGIAELAEKVIGVFYSIPKEIRKGRSVNITVSTSSFVPKPFTPFQWEPQNRMEELIEKQKLLKERIKSRCISYNWHQSDVSFLEAVFAKGDRRLGEVLIKAHEKGCRFDGWDEYFSYDSWREAFSECGIDPELYAYRKIDHGEVLPWDHIDIGVSRSFLEKEHERAYRGETTPSCREKCAGCGAASFGGGVCFE